MNYARKRKEINSKSFPYGMLAKCKSICRYNSDGLLNKQEVDTNFTDPIEQHFINFLLALKMLGGVCMRLKVKSARSEISLQFKKKKDFTRNGIRPKLNI